MAPQFLALPRLSRSGAFDDLPCSFSRANSGASCSRSRMYIATARSTAERRNGIRQPHCLKPASPSDSRVMRTTISATKNPTVAVV